ncbi:MAG: primosomal protein N' [Clostridia bacterium]|nr:primosomal protein N' [Clostridia bacterium]
MNNNTLIVGVAVEDTVFHFDKLFSYSVPESMKNEIKAGCRVRVPFGGSNRGRQGIVVTLSQGEAEGLKEVSALLDTTPVLSEELLKMAEFMQKHYFCTYFEAVKAMLPAGLNFKITTVYSAVREADTSVLSEEQRRIFDYVSKAKNPVKREKLCEVFGFNDIEPFEELTRKGFLQKSDDAFRKMGDASVKMLRLKEDVDLSSSTLTPKQESVAELLLTIGEASVREICYYTGVTSAVCDGLVKKGIAEYFDAEVFRNTVKVSEERLSLPVLSNEQEKVFEDIAKLSESEKGGVSLLYGVTGSGKTSVFMHLIKHTVDRGKGVIVMVPEISLTPQLVGKFTAIFGSEVAVFHSGLSLGERLDEYKRVKKGLARIAVGTRSAVFAPFDNLGLIIMDEEQEHTYKAENKPRFHARELAKFRCNYNNCTLLLSSATPDVCSFYYAQQGRYTLHTLKNRFGNATLPDVAVIDMNEELARGNTTGFSDYLLESLEENLKEGKQAILLLNRRGFNTFATCKSCKEVVTCPNCSISMTYHSANNRLMCHYCGYSVPFSDNCPSCHSKGLRLSGTGTQKAEQVLADILPSARILRLDADSVMAKNSHERLLSAFGRGEYDILIGTQMVAKGLDFPNVTLVGVLNADQMLYSDDYRSFERAFSMLTQVVGRSGRGEAEGKAIVQTFTPENPVIDLASKQDYDSFYADEILLRKGMIYPPFADLLLLGFVGEDKNKTIVCAKAFFAKLKARLDESLPDFPIRVLGPSPALVSKVSNKYRYKIIIKCRSTSAFRSVISSMLADFGKDREFKDVTVYADADPLRF